MFPAQHPLPQPFQQAAPPWNQGLPGQYPGQAQNWPPHQPQQPPQQLPLQPNFPPGPPLQQLPPQPMFPPGPSPQMQRDQFALHKLAEEIENVRLANEKQASKRYKLSDGERERIRQEVIREQTEQTAREQALVERVKREDAEKAAEAAQREKSLVEKIKLQELDKERREHEHEEALAAKMKAKAEKSKAEEAARMAEYEAKRQAALIREKQAHEAERAKLELAMRETLSRNGVPDRVINRIISQSTEAKTVNAVATSGISPGTSTPIIKKRYLSYSTILRFNVAIEPGRRNDAFWVLQPGTPEDIIREMFQYERDERRSGERRKRTKKSWALLRP